MKKKEFQIESNVIKLSFFKKNARPLIKTDGLFFTIHYYFGKLKVT